LYSWIDAPFFSPQINADFKRRFSQILHNKQKSHVSIQMPVAFMPKPFKKEICVYLRFHLRHLRDCISGVEA